MTFDSTKLKKQLTPSNTFFISCPVRNLECLTAVLGSRGTITGLWPGTRTLSLGVAGAGEAGVQH